MYSNEDYCFNPLNTQHVHIQHDNKLQHEPLQISEKDRFLLLDLIYQLKTLTEQIHNLTNKLNENKETAI